jgi:hypothetical protein
VIKGAATKVRDGVVDRDRAFAEWATIRISVAVAPAVAV